jgi:chromosome segregation protein
MLLKKQQEISEQITKLEGEIQTRQGKIDQLNISLRTSKLKKEQANQQKEWLAVQVATFQSQIQQINAEVDEQAASRVKNDTDLKQYRDDTETTQTVLKNLSVDGVQIELTHCSTRLAVIQQNFQQSQERLVEKEQMAKDLLERKNGLMLRISESEQTKKKTRNELASLQDNGKQLSVGIDAISEKIRPLENEIQEREREFDALQENLNGARMAVQIADRHSTQAQLDLSRQKDALESLQSRIEEDFGLVSYEYGADINGPTPLPLEGMVEQLPVVKELPPAFEENINRQKTQLRRMGPINMEAQKEFLEVSERFTFLTGQVADLNKADEDLRQVIAELDELMKKEFRKTFDAVAVEFKQMFTRLFNGGQARLELIDEDDPKSSGVDIEAKLPGRREQGLNLLSGGERSLTAVALIFSLLKISPTPFCILDEVDAMLDEANVGRFCDLLKELSENTQFIIITHNRNTVQVADVIYGVTMAKDSTSQVISLKMDEITDEIIN